MILFYFKSLCEYAEVGGRLMVASFSSFMLHYLTKDIPCLCAQRNITVVISDHRGNMAVSTSLAHCEVGDNHHDRKWDSQPV